VLLDELSLQFHLVAPLTFGLLLWLALRGQRSYPQAGAAGDAEMARPIVAAIDNVQYLINICLTTGTR